MNKIKINMLSGSSLEKPLVTAFKGNGGDFLVFDNEMNGTMGLPIILVSKLENNKLVMINDAEWNSVKESLRMIIAGNQVDYISVGDSLGADDMFFRQLTLPVASFDALKASYKPVGGNTLNGVEAAPVSEMVASVESAPQSMSNVGAPMSSVGPMPQVEPVNPTPIESTPVMPEIVPMPEQAVVQSPVMPATPLQNQMESVVAPVTPVNIVEAAPTVEPIPEVNNNENNVPMDFTADKEAFLKACENMFDALVAKFKN